MSTHQPDDAVPEAPQLGVGDQVIIKHDSKDGDRDWVGEPSGEIVASADDQGWDVLMGEMSADFPWIVSFDEPQFLKDGEGPFDKTTVAAWRLVLAPTVYADEPAKVPLA